MGKRESPDEAGISKLGSGSPPMPRKRKSKVLIWGNLVAEHVTT
jgi:hypothetical protein